MISSSSERATGLAGYYFVWPMHSVALPPHRRTPAARPGLASFCVCTF